MASGTVTLRPANDFITEWTPFPPGTNFSTVDEATQDPSDYVHASALSTDFYSVNGAINAAALAQISGKIITDVRVTVRCQLQPGGTAARIQAGTRQGGGEEFLPSPLGEALSASLPTTVTQSFTSNPSTGVAWLETEIESMRIGQKLQTAFEATVHVWQVYAEVDWEDVVLPTFAGRKVFSKAAQPPPNKKKQASFFLKLFSPLFRKERDQNIRSRERDSVIFSKQAERHFLRKPKGITGRKKPK